MSLLERLVEQAKSYPKRIVLPEGEDPRILSAAARARQDGIAHPIVLGDLAAITSLARELGVSLDGIVVRAPTQDADREELANQLFERRKHKGLSESDAQALSVKPLVFADLLVLTGQADGAVAGAIHTTADVVRNALQIVGMVSGAQLVSSFFLMTEQVSESPRAWVFADCALNIEPSAAQLADIAVASGQQAATFLGADPKIAMLSFATHGSADHPLVDKVREATHIAQQQKPDWAIDGELQLDAAIVPKVADQKAPGSSVGGDANVLVFPSLEAGNIGYKLAQRLGGLVAVGPFLQGLASPVNDLSRGSTEDDIYYTIATTVVQAQ